jgi:uncharacterized metal-binding protein
MMALYKDHEIWSLSVLLLALCALKVDIHILQLIASWLLGILILSPDLDAEYSRPKNRIGVLKVFFSNFKHRGILHNPIFWSLILLGFYHYNYTWIGIGLFGSAIVHIIIDKL